MPTVVACSWTARQQRLPGYDNRRFTTVLSMSVACRSICITTPTPSTLWTKLSILPPTQTTPHGSWLTCTVGRRVAVWIAPLGSITRTHRYHSHTSLLAAEYRDRVALIGADVLHGTLK